MADEQAQPEMGETQEAQAQQVQPEMGKTGEAGELEQIRAALKKANGEAAKYRKIAEQVEAERKAKAEAEMTELQKAQARLSEIEGELARERRTRLQSEIAAKVGLPAALATRLQGETPEDLEADAKAILEQLPKPPKPTPGIRAANPGAAGQPAETREQKKARLTGQNPDLTSIRGGGVVWPRSAEE